MRLYDGHRLGGRVPGPSDRRACHRFGADSNPSHSTDARTLATVDVADWPWLSKWKWYAIFGHGYFYAARTTSRKDGKRHLIRKHRLIMGAAAGQQIDHINHQTCDNRRVNLRPCNRNKNQWNRALNKNSASGFKGVSFNRECGKFVAYIQFNGHRKHLGCFATASAAAAAYDAKATKLHRDFARTNSMLASQ